MLKNLELSLAVSQPQTIFPSRAVTKMAHAGLCSGGVVFFAWSLWFNTSHLQEARFCIAEAIESLPLANTPEVFGLHANAEIGYYTQAVRDIWSHLLELQPQTGQFSIALMCFANVTNEVVSLNHFCFR